MKLFSTISVILLFCAYSFAQNLPPQISNTQIAISGQNNATINYVVTDFEQDSLEVGLHISFNNGLTFRSYPATGAVGFPILSGSHQLQFVLPNAIAGVNPIAKLVITDRKPKSIHQIIAAIDSQVLKQQMEYIAIPRRFGQNAIALNGVKDTIVNAFNASGLTTSLQSFPYGTYSAANIIGRKQGIGGDSTTIILDAHFDAVSNTPGADDNASGVVGVLAIANAFKDSYFRNNITFLGFDLEEIGLVGSQVYVQSGILSDEKIKGVFNLEMIGYYDEAPNTQTLPAGFNILFPAVAQAVAADSAKGNFLANVANVASDGIRAIFDSCAAAYVPSLRVLSMAVPGNGQIAPDLRRSDHSRFWDANIPALMLTNSSEFRNNRYHTPADSAATLNYTFMTNVIKATAATIAAMAEPINADTAMFILPAIATNLHSHSFEAEVKIFPNPSNGEFNVKIANWKAAPDKAVLRVFAMNGQIVFEKSIWLAQTETISFNLGERAQNGNYMLVIEASDCSFSQVIQVLK